ncbi:MAG TPA: hypothetical protein VME22_17340 [Solirubrobacteraceae bacterium]|nr:hypothetical protein [Solirubrobacteraceae bacterium]
MPGAMFSIPPRVRRAILDLLDGWGARPPAVIAELGQRRGIYTVGDLMGIINDNYGGEARAQFGGTLMQWFERLTPPALHASSTGMDAPLRNVAAAALVAVPDDLFLLAAELGRELVARGDVLQSGGIDYTLHQYQERLIELFVGNGVPWELDEEGRFVPSGSPTVTAAAVQPAMDVLDDPRLTDARGHLIEAQRRLREPDPEEAVDEARQAVEAAMLAVLDAHGIPWPGTRTPDQLYNALAPTDPTAPRAMSRDAIELVLAAPRFRGRTAAGHAGGAPVTLGEAEATVAAAAAALLYLADKLP